MQAELEYGPAVCLIIARVFLQSNNRLPINHLHKSICTPHRKRDCINKSNVEYFTGGTISRRPKFLRDKLILSIIGNNNQHQRKKVEDSIARSVSYQPPFLRLRRHTLKRQIAKIHQRQENHSNPDRPKHHFSPLFKFFALHR